MPQVTTSRSRDGISTRAEVLLTLISGVWAGLIIGVSFLATLVKFRAQSLTMPVALDVGAHTFTALVRVEWIFVVMTVVLWSVARPVRSHSIIHLVQIALFVMEAFWLLPILEARAQVVIGGGSAEPSYAHIIFVAFEVIRVILLLISGASLTTENSAPTL
jgi:hypothetical protein